MTFNKVISPAALFLLLGSGASVYGQHEEQSKEPKPEAKAAPQERAQPEQRAPQPKQQAQQPKEKAQPQQKAQPQEKAPREQPAQRAQQPKPQAQPARQEAQQPKPQAQQPKQQAKQPVTKAPQQQQHAQSQQPAQHMQAVQQIKPSALKANYTPPLRTRQQATTWQQQSGWRQDGAWQEHASWQQDRSSNWQSDHRTWAQRGGYGGYYIPQSSFNLHFGIGNWFRIQTEPVIFGGYPRFQYGGYSFLMVDPWPADWAQNWYSADDVYVGYDNGYYLYNRDYPNEAIAITVVL
jgi:hypothetical protein